MRAFNQNIGSWDTSSVSNMQSMFSNGLAFNQDISSWDVSNVTNMSYMFENGAFVQDISSWNVSSVTTFTQMFYNVPAYPTATYNAINTSWGNQNTNWNAATAGLQDGGY